MRVQSKTTRRGLEPSFTLLEMVGVLSILLILGAMVTGSVSMQVRTAHRLNERANLEQIVAGFRDQVLRSRSMPAMSQWASFVADGLGMPSSQVAMNPLGHARVFRFDPAFQLGRPLQSPVTAGSALVQTASGSLLPESARLVVMGSSGAPLPDVSGVVFDSIWNCAPGALPQGWPAWNGTGADLMIARASLRDLYVRVIFQNNDFQNAAPYAVHTIPDANAIAVGGRHEAWFYRGSILYLSQADGVLQAAEVLKEDTSYSFEAGQWSPRVMVGRNANMSDFAILADIFMGLPAPSFNPGKPPSSPQNVMEEMYLFMYHYARWATNGFPGRSTGIEQFIPEYKTLYQTRDRLGAYSDQLIGVN